MVRKIEPAQRMSSNDAAEIYPDSYILMRIGSVKMTAGDEGDILYVSDNEDELYPILRQLDESEIYLLTEGMTHRCSLGGVVVGEYS
jgi:hypothetical protein